MIGAIICSENAIALDTVATDMVGLKTKEVWTQVAGQKRGIKESTIKNIEFVGDRIRVKNFMRAKSMVKFPKFVSRLLKNHFTARPVLNPKKCISCAGCYNVCPAGAIDFATKKPIFDYEKCIRCYCCHEVCPEKAIHLKSGIFAKMSSKILK